MNNATRLFADHLTKATSIITPKLIHRTTTMSAFTLYGSRGSSNTDRVRLVLAEGGVKDYNLVLLDLMKGEQKDPSKLALNPFGKVPILSMPGGFTLYESRAICTYLVRHYSLPLLPASDNIEALAAFDQAQGVEMAYFADPAHKIGFELMVKKRIGLPTDMAVVETSKKALEAYFDIAEVKLGKEGYMAGKEFTMVDIYYIPLVNRLYAVGMGELVEKRENLKAWWNRVVSRPAMKALLDADKQAMAAAARK